MNHIKTGIALAATIALLTPPASAFAPPAASRVEIAPSPTPSPPIGTLIRVNAPNQAQHTAQITQNITQRMTALSRLQPRAFKARSSLAVARAHQDVAVSRRAGASFNHPANYCAQHQPEIDRVTGDVTPGGVLTISGICFGTSGNVRITGRFPYELNGVPLRIETWSDSLVKVLMFHNAYGGIGSTADSFTASLDQPIELKLATHRVAGGMDVVGPTLISDPVRLNFVAKRVTITAPFDVVACAGGDSLEAQRPDFCGEFGWGSFKCDIGACAKAYHARKTAATGEDVYSIHLNHGFVLSQVLLFADAADLVFDPSLDPSHVTFRVRWRTVHKSDPDLVKQGHPQYADYHDGSYMFYPMAIGPDGVAP